MDHATPINILGISGSLRRGSFNTRLLSVAQSVAPEGVTIDIADISPIPLYNADEERELGFPESVTKLRGEIASADGLLFSSPEYNFSVTGALKNAIDWASRPPDSPLNHKPAAIMGAGGGSGTARAQRHLREILSHNHVRVVADPQVHLAGAWKAFDGDRLIEEAIAASISELMAALVRVIERARRVPPPQVSGSVLVVGRHPPSVDEVTRQLAELGYRSLLALDDDTAVDGIRHRRIVAMLLGGGVEFDSRRLLRKELEKVHPGTPVIEVTSAATAAAEVDTTLR